jgi:hypothetical protein
LPKHYFKKEAKNMNSPIQAAVEVFTSKVLPALRKWKYTVVLTRSSPTHACWEFRWDNLASYIEVRWEKMVLSKTKEAIAYQELVFVGKEFYDPYTANSEVILQKFMDAVESAIVFSCMRELERIYFRSNEAVKGVWWKTRTVEWATRDCFYMCTLIISLSKSPPTWRWVCEFADPKSPLKLCELEPTEEIVNPTEAFLKFSRATIAEALL